MNNAQSSLSTEQALAAAMQSLFQRYPFLHGFAIEKRKMPSDGTGRVEHRLSLSELVVHPWQDADLPALLEGEIVMALADFLQDRPEAAPLLPGRTFARHVH